MGLFAHWLMCVECGKDFESRNPAREFCGVGCTGEYFSHRSERPKIRSSAGYRSVARRQERIHANYVEHVDKTKVFERDQYTCYLCGSITDKSDGWPSPNYPTLDHYIPLSKGGEHSYANSRTCCWSCNLRKRGALPPEKEYDIPEDANEAFMESGDWDELLYD